MTTITRREALLLAALLLLAATLRLAVLGRCSIWEDEVVVMRLARQAGPLALLRALPVLDASSAPLHPLLLQGWLACFGDSLVTARLLSAVCGIVAVGLVYVLGRQAYDGRTGLVAALLMAVNPLELYHDREVRMYAGLVLVTCACWVMLLSFRRSASLGKQAAYALFLAALVYIHPLGVLMVGALAVGYLATRSETGLSWVSFIQVHLTMGLLVAPWAIHYVDHRPGSLTPRLNLKLLLEWPEAFTGGRAESVWVAALLISYGVVESLRRRRHEQSASPSAPAAAALLAWLLVPVGLLLAYGFTRHPIFGARRYLLYVGPAYLLLAARGLTALPRRLPIIGALVLAALAASTLPRRVYDNRRADWSGAAALIRTYAPKAPIVVLDDENHYCHRQCLEFGLNPGTKSIPVCRYLEALKQAPQPADRRIWFVFLTDLDGPPMPLPEPLKRLYTPERTWDLPCLRLSYNALRPEIGARVEDLSTRK